MYKHGTTTGYDGNDREDAEAGQLREYRCQQLKERLARLRTEMVKLEEELKLESDYFWFT